MRTIVHSVLFAATLLSFGGPAFTAETIKLGDLLNQGYEIRAVNTLDEPMARRIGGDAWKDGLLLTLQRGNDVAFCHFLLSATIDAAASSFKDGGCGVIK